MKKSFLEISDGHVDKPSRIKRIYANVFKEGITDFLKMEDLPLPLRITLAEQFAILSLREEKRIISSDGTVKFLFELEDGLFVESVLLIDHKKRVTMCISSQVGCRMGCVFCKTGKMGLKRNLSAYEIVSQVIAMFHYMADDLQLHSRMFNIVFMGMGEPLDNYQSVAEAIKILAEPAYFALHPSWITVSTCGVLDKIEPLLELYPRLKITVSLHTAIEEKRRILMPISQKYPVTEIASVLNRIHSRYRQRLTLEYILIENYNMGTEDIDALELFRSKIFHLNLIPINSGEAPWRSPDGEKIEQFVKELITRGFFVTKRTRRGEDIQADCGQLYLAAEEGETKKPGAL